MYEKKLEYPSALIFFRAMSKMTHERETRCIRHGNQARGPEFSYTTLPFFLQELVHEKRASHPSSEAREQRSGFW